MTALDEIKKYSVVVADTADFEKIKEFQPIDGTTNPSLIFAGTKLPCYQHLIDKAINFAKDVSKNNTNMYPNTKEGIIDAAMEKISVLFGCEILKIIPGRVSTEIDAKYSFNSEECIKRARRIIKLYQEENFGKDRIYIKIAATWEGIQAAKILEKEGVCCNLTLIFNFFQAVACAQANVSLISPFVGRILDWHKKNSGKEFLPTEDPGVLSVTRIYNYYKKHNYKTVIMGASFRNVNEIILLAGCDKLTISPSLLSELAKMPASSVKKQLDPSNPVIGEDANKIPELTHDKFLFTLNEDPMTVEKLSEGIRNFNKDTRLLEKIIIEKLS